MTDEKPPVCDIGPAPLPPENEVIESDVVDPVNYDIEVGPEKVAPVITGGEGYGVVRRRHLLVLIPLPEYLKDKEHPEKGIDFLLQGQMLESDIRVAMAQAARKLDDTASKYRVTGYDWDLEDIQYDIPSPRTVMATLVIERE
jgi:hypothetical protein